VIYAPKVGVLELADRIDRALRELPVPLPRSEVKPYRHIDK
jgi:hypothetical protein